MTPSTIPQRVGRLPTRPVLALVCAFAVALSIGPSAAVASGPPRNQGGPVQTAPQIYIDFWGPGWSKDPLNERQYLTNFVRSINRSSWLEILGQYGAGWQHTTYVTSWSDTAISHRPGPDPSQDTTKAEATRAAHHFGIRPNHNVEIIIALPVGGTCRPYHSWDSDVGVAFVAYPYNGDPFPNHQGECAPGARTVSHEIAETMTDPITEPGHFAWQPEVADPCDAEASRTVTMPDGQKFLVQAIWSNKANGGPRRVRLFRLSSRTSRGNHFAVITGCTATNGQISIRRERSPQFNTTR